MRSDKKWMTKGREEIIEEEKETKRDEGKQREERRGEEGKWEDIAKTR